VFRIKICGITNVEDARAAVEAGADCLGLNFYPGSKRYITVAIAEQIVASLPDDVLTAGVFVNAPLSQIRTIADRLRLDLVQLHGDEPPETIAELAPRAVMKALRSTSASWASVEPRMVLWDAAVPGEFGGTGHRADWQAAIRYSQLPGSRPLVLAGGLTPDNVAEAIRTVRPAAVDTASGVEQSPGRKDRVKMGAFVSAARAAFAELERRG
jgi:phosphoribosylanthranilate isomerase